MANDAHKSSNALATRLQHPELVEQLASFVTDLEFSDLSDDVVKHASLFLMDTIAVGIAATTYHATDKALASVKSWGSGDQARVIGRPDVRLPGAAAAFINGMQVHALEWDGLHEKTVVIALCASIGALVSELDQTSCNGEDLICAFTLGVEVAVFFGGVTDSSPRFFRPSVAGGLGAAMALARLRKLSKDQTIAALGLAYSQACGTMQAHWEGSMALPMQVGAVARNAHFAVDMAQAGMTGPVDIIAGQFNYFSLFENGVFNQSTMENLGKPFKITEVAHKPFPAGRATQAVLTMLQECNQTHEFDITDIIEIKVYVPPLIMLLVGRPIEKGMTASYARLCLKFIMPLMLLDREIDPRRFIQEVYSDPGIVALSEKISILDDGNQDKNALGPQTMSIHFNDDHEIALSCIDPLGSPNNPLNQQQRNQKIMRCFELGLPERNATEFIDCCERLAELEDCRQILNLVS